MGRRCTPSTAPTRSRAPVTASPRSATTCSCPPPGRSRRPTRAWRPGPTRLLPPRSSRPSGRTAISTRSSSPGGWRHPVSGSRKPFQYAALRIVPRVERGEAVNAGVVLFCRPLRFLGARTELDVQLLRALSPDCDPEAVSKLLRTIELIAAADPAGGPIAELPASERFHWLVAPASTIVQSGPVHTGLTADPEHELAQLFAKLVER